VTFLTKTMIKVKSYTCQGHNVWRSRSNVM